MGRVERNTLDSVTDLNLSYSEGQANKWLHIFFRKLDEVFIQRGVILTLIGFLLGRALILSQLAPFAIPFFAAVYLLQKNKAPYALIGLIAGAATIHVMNATVIFAAAIIFMMLHKIREPSLAQQYKLVPIYVFVAFGFTNFGMHYIIERKLLLYDSLMMGVEAGLAFILTLIFIQCIPLIFSSKRSRTLRTEEVVSLTILIASILTGTIGWTIYDLSFEHILSRYLVLVFALSAGAAIGSTVGVVTGLIFSLASVATLFQMSLLAFAGLLGGLLKEGRKI